jgi:alpha-tubulin suppressor-like RCC1 family protein
MKLRFLCDTNACEVEFVVMRDRSPLSAASLALLVALAGCSDDDDPLRDAGPGEGGVDADTRARPSIRSDDPRRGDAGRDAGMDAGDRDAAPSSDGGVIDSGMVEFCPDEGGAAGDEDGGAGTPFCMTPLLAAGADHTCGARSDGSVRCWGSDGWPGQLTPPADLRVRKLAVGSGFTCGIRIDGTLSCWGRNQFALLDAPVGRFVEVTAGALFACAIRDDGTLACWGQDQEGQTSPPPGEFTAVSAGNAHACALALDQTVRCWGWNDDRQSDPPEGRYLAVSARAFRSCALDLDGSIVCWGRSNNAAAPAGSFTAIGLGDFHACALRPNKGVACWGRDDHGIRDAPTGTFLQLASGWSHTCALRTDGVAECWGYGKQTEPCFGGIYDCGQSLVPDDFP